MSVHSYDRVEISRERESLTSLPQAQAQRGVKTFTGKKIKWKTKTPRGPCHNYSRQRDAHLHAKVQMNRERGAQQALKKVDSESQTTNS
jgi:hypothetical protein